MEVPVPLRHLLFDPHVNLVHELRRHTQFLPGKQIPAHIPIRQEMDEDRGQVREGVCKCSQSAVVQVPPYQKVVDIRTSIDRIRECAFFGRFSAYLLLEAFMGVFGKDGFFSGELNFWEGDTATSGLLNVMGRDADADAFDAGALRVLDADSMKKTLDTILSRLHGAGNCSIAFVETSLCAYRKLFKGSRYLGYYTDRCLQELNCTKKAFPGFSRQLSLFTDARLSTLPVKCLGELGGWDGVRKDRKKRFLSGKGF